MPMCLGVKCNDVYNLFSNDSQNGNNNINNMYIYVWLYVCLWIYVYVCICVYMCMNFICKNKYNKVFLKTSKSR